MPLPRKTQLAAIVENQPFAEQTSFAGSDALNVLEAQFSQDRTLNERLPAGATLSTDVEAVGRGSAGVQCQVDLKGSGVTASTKPEWNDLARACGLVEAAMKQVKFATAPSVPLLIGDVLTGATSGAVARVVHNHAGGAGTNVTVFPLNSTAFSTNEVVNITRTGGPVGVNTDGTTAEVPSVGWSYTPGSSETYTITTTGAWSVSDPADGETFTVTVSGLVVGGFQIVSVSTTTTVATHLWGTCPASASLTSTSGKTATAAASNQIVATDIPSLSLYHNRDGLKRVCYAARGTWGFSAEAGGNARASFEFTGKAGAYGDAPFLTGTSFQTSIPPRLVAGYVYIDGIPIPVRQAEFTAQNQVAMRADGNSAEGDLGAVITSRDPQLVLTVDQVGLASFDWWTAWKESTPLLVALQLGKTTANRIGFIAPKAQIRELPDGDADGIATHQVTLALRRYTSDGDDEFVLAHS